jgi:DNA-binding transcriptional ArsR family regulator
MDVDVETHRMAALLGDASRSRMLACLMDGRAKTAKELAYAARITPATASSHLAKLVGGAVLAVEVQGRHRYFRIAREEVADLVEALMTATGREPLASAAGERGPLPPIKFARMCYDHLAGRVGVEVMKALLRRRWLVTKGRDLVLTRLGEEFVSSLGIEVERVRTRRRRFACTCLDWSERTPHLGGALGQELAERFIADRWLRRAAESRVLILTEKGRRGLAERLGVCLSA